MTRGPAALARFDQLIKACDEMAERTGITFDGRGPMPMPYTRSLHRRLWNTAKQAWGDGLFCDHAIAAVEKSPAPLYFQPIDLDGPHGVFCGDCAPPISENDWYKIPKARLRRMRCDVCSARFPEWDDIRPIVINQLNWAVVGRCCWDCSRDLRANRDRITAEQAHEHLTEINRPVPERRRLPRHRSREDHGRAGGLTDA